MSLDGWVIKKNMDLEGESGKAEKEDEIDKKVVVGLDDVEENGNHKDSKKNDENDSMVDENEKMESMSDVDGDKNDEADLLKDDATVSTKSATKEGEDQENALSGKKAKQEQQKKKQTEKKSPTQGTTEKKKPRKSSGGTNSKKSHVDYVHEAIVALKSKSGSSGVAISKYVLGTNTDIDYQKFKKRLNITIKAGLKSGRFAKVKSSYKINPAWTKKIKRQEAAAMRKKKLLMQKKKTLLAKKTKEAEKKAKEAKLAKEKEAKQAAKLAAAKAALKEAAKNKAKAEEIPSDPIEKKIFFLKKEKPVNEKKIKKLQEQLRKKKEHEEWKQKVAEALRKRRYPMEDTILHKEDKELKLKPPDDVTPRPSLPYVFSLSNHHTKMEDTNLNEVKKRDRLAVAASKAEDLDSGSRGLVPDLLQVYHFFCGDVHYSTIYKNNHRSKKSQPVVPSFQLHHLFNAVQEINSGNAKKSRMVPPLIVHLFCVTLELLLNKDALSEPTDNMENPYYLKNRRQLQLDFESHLSPALSPASWADVCFMYMDAMERYYTTEASLDNNVVTCDSIDSAYLFHLKDEENNSEDNSAIPFEYSGYLGQPKGALARAHTRLAKQDPWDLSAEEIMALLRSLTDDVLSNQPEIGRNIESRLEGMKELERAKRSADSKFRKTRLAFQGPKRSNTSTKKKDADSDEKKISAVETNDNKTASTEQLSDHHTPEMMGKSQDSNEEDKKKQTPEKSFKPTVTKNQFETAKKQQQRASDAFEKGAQTLIARTGPFGLDRDHNAVYFFRQDPEILYFEMIKRPEKTPLVASKQEKNQPSRIPFEYLNHKTSWHLIKTKSLFDEFISSLDIRGKREYELHEDLLGPPGSNQSLRRFLHDDMKERSIIKARLKEKDVLLRRKENARIMCDEEGRRSGRLAGRGSLVLAEIEAKLVDVEAKIKAANEKKQEPDYEELTGYKLLYNFDNEDEGKVIKTRRERNDALQDESENKLTRMHCSKLLSGKNSDCDGIISFLVSQLLEVEELCETLEPWDKEQKDTRKSWRADLEELVHEWNVINLVQLGPMISATNNNDNNQTSTERDNKRRKVDGKISSSLTLDASSMKGKPGLQTSQILTKLKQALLGLEERLFVISGLSVATRDADVADDNMSTDGMDKLDEERERRNKKERIWKKKIYRLGMIPTKRGSQIRELLLEAIAAARHAKLKVIVTQLRDALLEYHPRAPYFCKTKAMEVLQNHGGYEPDDEDDDDSEDDEESKAGQEEDQELPSALSAEAVIMNSSLEGIEDASRSDWKKAVKSSKTFSRISALITAFTWRSSKYIRKLQAEHDRLLQAISYWKKEKSRKKKGNKKKVQSPFDGSTGDLTEVWTKVQYTDEICMAKVGDYPWWPAKKCIACDEEIAKSLELLDRSLVSLIGEQGSLRVTKTATDLREYTGAIITDEEEEETDEEATDEEELDKKRSNHKISDKDLRTQLGDCMSIARRISRSNNSVPSSVLAKKERKKTRLTRPDCVEEKKMSN